MPLSRPDGRPRVRDLLSIQMEPLFPRQAGCTDQPGISSLALFEPQSSDLRSVCPEPACLAAQHPGQAGQHYPKELADDRRRRSPGPAGADGRAGLVEAHIWSGRAFRGRIIGPTDGFRGSCWTRRGTDRPGGLSHSADLHPHRLQHTDGGRTDPVLFHRDPFPDRDTNFYPHADQHPVADDPRIAYEYQESGQPVQADAYARAADENPRATDNGSSDISTTYLYSVDQYISSTDKDLDPGPDRGPPIASP